MGSAGAAAGAAGMTDVEELRRQRDLLVEAVRFYADSEHWPVWDGAAEATWDAGARARQALKDIADEDV